MTRDDDDRDDGHELRSFGRRRGRKLSARHDRLIGELLPEISPDLATPAGPISDVRPAPFTDLWLEIGFGGGEHLVWQAQHNPGVLMIGCEPFVDGVAKVLSAIDAGSLGNIRVHADDARALLRWLPTASIGRCFILFPDPWPKKRHVKRRLVQPSLLAQVARVLRPGGELRVGTDIGDYARTILLAVAATPQLHWTASCPDDWRVRPPDWPPTRYEEKAVREGRKRYFLTFRRAP